MNSTPWTRPDNAWIDAVQLKITLAGPEVDQALAAFQLTSRHPHRSRIYFCELPSYAGRLPLLDAGLILRLRTHDEGRDDTMVMLRPCRRHRLSPRWTALRTTGQHEFRLDGDWSPSQHVLAATLSQARPRHSIDHLIARPAALPEAFSALQQEFIADCADLHPHLTELQLFGPIHTQHWTLNVDELPVAVERWTIPETTIDLLELSVRAPPADAPFLRPALTALVRRHGLDPDAVTTTKTRLALDHFTTSAGG